MAIPFISYLSYGSWFLCSVRYAGSLGVSSLRGYRSVFSAVFRFTFHPYLRIRCFGCCYAPSNSLQRSVCYVPILGTCLWCCLSSLAGLCAFVSGLLPHSPADDIVFAGSCHCQYGLGSYRLSLPWSPLWLGMIAFLTSRSWSPSRSRSPVPSLAPSWWRP